MIKKAIMLSFVFFALTAGCGSDSKDVKETILRYNQLLSESYSRLNMNSMQEAATLDHAQKLYHHMAALGEGRVRMESRLKKIDFIGIKFPDKKNAVVKDREVWDFRHVDRESGRVGLEEKDFVYELTYELIKSGDRWIVKSVTYIGEDKPSRKK